MVTQEDFDQIVKLAHTTYQLEKHANELENKDNLDKGRTEFLRKAIQNQRGERLKKLGYLNLSPEEAYLDYVSKFNTLYQEWVPHIHLENDDDTFAKHPFNKAQLSDCFIKTIVVALNDSFKTEYQYSLEKSSSHKAAPIGKVLSSIMPKPVVQNKEKKDSTKTYSPPSLKKTK